MTTRRAFFGALAALTGAVVMPKAAHPRYGYVTAADARKNGWRTPLVLLNGRDVTGDCCAMDDEKGFVDLLSRPVRMGNDLTIVKNRLFGRVQFFPNRPARQKGPCLG